MGNDDILIESQKEWHGTLKAYGIGFLASFILTACSFLLAASKSLAGLPLVILLVLLAIAQAIVQLRFFLHLGQEAKPRWETLVFGFMVLVVLILALGSFWIMYDLNDRLMSNTPMEQSHD
jgi:cytochrome o ubiquinol oxidase operon protein cyoD